MCPQYSKASPQSVEDQLRSGTRAIAVSLPVAVRTKLLLGSQQAAIETEVLSQPMTGYTLHRRSFGTDVLRCPCGGRRAVTALHSTRKAAEERLAELGLPPRSLLLPPQTAPPQLDLDV